MKNIITLILCLLLSASPLLVKAQTCHAGTVSALKDTVCQGLPVTLKVTGSSGNIQWQEATGDTFGIIAGASDSLFVTHLQQTAYFRVVVNSGSCSDTSAAVKVFVPAPLTVFFSTTTTGNSTSFNTDSSMGDIARYHWDFRDGDTSNAADPVHTYTEDTMYYVCLTAFDSFGCSYTFCRYLDNTLDGGGQCHSSFGYSIKGDTVYFYGGGNSFETVYSWGVGSNGVSIGGDDQDPVFLYNSQGVYDVCLSVIDYEQNCSSQTCQSISLGVNTVLPKQQALIVYPNSCTACELKGAQNTNDLLVTDLLGRLVPVSFVKESNSYRLSFSSNGAGMYLIKNVRTGEVVKFVKE